jgi:hypothetical protein
MCVAYLWVMVQQQQSKENKDALEGPKVIIIECVVKKTRDKLTKDEKHFGTTL